MLYPLKFEPELLSKIWGGQRIRQWYPAAQGMDNVGESWVVAAIEDHNTVVANGRLAGNDLQELLEVYMEELVGDRIFEEFGTRFPLLVKFIDADADLSVQVHPDDEQAWEEQESLGKNEMWYVDSASAADASVISGFVRDMSAEAVEQSLANGDILSCLAGYSVKGGDVININTGTVHALKKGTIVAEIQENSDVTYRLYDYDRVGQDGKKRPLHISQALRALHYEASKHAVVHPDYRLNTVTNLKRCRFFTVNAIDLDRPLQRDYAPLDSFVIYMCVEGAVQVDALDAEEEREVNLAKGEALLIPACLNDIVLRNTSGNARILEIYVEPDLD